jgi:hypothetical protein
MAVIHGIESFDDFGPINFTFAWSPMMFKEPIAVAQMGREYSAFKLSKSEWNVFPLGEQKGGIHQRSQIL